MALTDESPMPFGKHKGEKMANVPASYLLWIYDEWTLPSPRFGFVHKEVKEYIEENLDVLKKEVKS
ncbi:putative quorum-sensing-regulated virulence factor [Bacteroides fragilis]